MANKVSGSLETMAVVQTWSGGVGAGVSSGRIISGPIGGPMHVQHTQKPDYIHDAPDRILIMELIGRGYAVAKLSVEDLVEVVMT